MTATMRAVLPETGHHAGASAPLLTVDLAAVRANFREMRRRFRGATLSAVLKSNAYGLGLEPVARALGDAGCGHVWVNDLDEALVARGAVPDATVYTLMGLAGLAADDAEAAGVVPALSSFDEVEACVRHAQACGRRMPVAIQLDTGLGRLGLGPAEVERLAGRPELLRGLDLRCYVTHLASYNLPEDPVNGLQRERLMDWTARLPKAPVSLAASSAVFMPPDWHFDMARIGSALVGVQTSVRWQEGLKPCYALDAPLIRIADHSAGRRLGYRGISELRRASRVATAAIGYANGLPQTLAEHGTARIGASQVPIVGGLAMNMTMLDVTDVPEGTAQVGARAVFFDEHQPLEPLADRLGCAPNVLLTQIGAGTRKRYLGD